MIVDVKKYKLLAQVIENRMTLYYSVAMNYSAKLRKSFELCNTLTHRFARRNYFRRHTQISESVHVFICTFYRNLTPYRLQLAKQENRNKYLNNTLILFVNNIYSAG